MAVFTNDDAPRPVLVAADYDVRRGDSYVEVTSGAAEYSVRLLPAASVPGATVTVKDGTGAARDIDHSIDVMVRLLVLDTDPVHFDLTALTDFDFTVAAATTAALASHTAVGSGASHVLTASGNGALVIDGVTLNNADVLLVKDETDARQNGRYTVTAKGDSTHPWILTRTGSLASPGTKSKAAAGTANANKIYAVRGGIDDSFVVYIRAAFDSVTVVSNGTNWRVTKPAEVVA